jgi:hypothetical protein
MKYHICLLTLFFGACQYFDKPKPDYTDAYLLMNMERPYSEAELKDHYGPKNMPRLRQLEEAFQLYQEAFDSDSELNAHERKAFQEMRVTLMNTAYQMAFPADELALLSAADEEHLPFMIEFFKTRLANACLVQAYAISAASNHHNVLLQCPDTIALGDTLTAVIYANHIFPNGSVQETPAAVFVPGAKANVQEVSLFTNTERQLSIYQCVPQQWGPHYIRFPFVIKTAQGNVVRYPLGKCFFVKRK